MRNGGIVPCAFLRGETWTRDLKGQEVASGLMKEKIAVALPWANGQNLDGIESISEKPTGHRFQGPVTSSTTLPSTRRRGYSLSTGIRVSHLENVGETE